MTKRPRAAVQEIGLQEIARLLNEGFNPERPFHIKAHANLVKLVEAWHQTQSAPKNAFEVEHGAPVPTLLKMKRPPDCPDWHEVQNRCRAYLLLSGTGVLMHVEYVGEKGKLSAWDGALNLFIQLMTNPARDKLSGPCARCGEYYVRKRASQKVYCSRTCGNNATAVIRTREKWDEQRKEKLDRARRTAQKWARSKIKEHWKEYIHARHPDISPKFLTRAVNQNELSEPKSLSAGNL
jgi:hypothetical protein